jgi:hypothetical protein
MEACSNLGPYASRNENFVRVSDQFAASPGKYSDVSPRIITDYGPHFAAKNSKKFICGAKERRTQRLRDVRITAVCYSTRTWMYGGKACMRERSLSRTITERLFLTSRKPANL